MRLGKTSMYCLVVLCAFALLVPGHILQNSYGHQWLTECKTPITVNAKIEKIEIDWNGPPNLVMDTEFFSDIDGEIEVIYEFSEPNHLRGFGYAEDRLYFGTWKYGAGPYTGGKLYDVVPNKSNYKILPKPDSGNFYEHLTCFSDISENFGSTFRVVEIDELHPGWVDVVGILMALTTAGFLLKAGQKLISVILVNTGFWVQIIKWNIVDKDDQLLGRTVDAQNIWEHWKAYWPVTDSDIGMANGKTYTVTTVYDTKTEESKKFGSATITYKVWLELAPDKVTSKHLAHGSMDLSAKPQIQKQASKTSSIQEQSFTFDQFSSLLQNVDLQGSSFSQWLSSVSKQQIDLIKNIIGGDSGSEEPSTKGGGKGGSKNIVEDPELGISYNTKKQVFFNTTTGDIIEDVSVFLHSETKPIIPPEGHSEDPFPYTNVKIVNSETEIIENFDGQGNTKGLAHWDLKYANGTTVSKIRGLVDVEKFNETSENGFNQYWLESDSNGRITLELIKPGSYNATFQIVEADKEFPMLDNSVPPLELTIRGEQGCVNPSTCDRIRSCLCGLPGSNDETPLEGESFCVDNVSDPETAQDVFAFCIDFCGSGSPSQTGFGFTRDDPTCNVD